MSLHGQYDSQNIFALILRGEAPSYKIYEDADVMAFLDVFPQSRGHVLVIPKASQARNILEVEPAILGAMMSAVQRLTRVIVNELKPDGVQIAQFNGAVAGQTVYHIHVHIIPRWEGEKPGEHGRGKADPEELKVLQARLVERIRSMD
ncbi:histidine triad (HIT) family protein [Pseudomonas brassicacearum]|uniref:Histidine triad (HIT) family protein n=1 Tax=Pseudomonas brassicacearum TaxID=930166 RepID=A0AAW8M9E2_9PSED|nr:HIT family protein [Pseudomonas brassicacearum]MDR6957717.1 histidine triad (HIT) family protein [Pseudomonas brassicacearum]